MILSNIIKSMNTSNVHEYSLQHELLNGKVGKMEGDTQVGQTSGEAINREPRRTRK
jgi:hypothetical protein